METKKDLKTDFAERMRYFMKKGNFTFAVLNLASGMSKSKLCQIAQGKVDPRLSTAGRIIEALEMNAGEFFAELENTLANE